MSEPFDQVDDLDDPPAGAVRAVLGLGANLGDRAATLQSAVTGLAGFEGVQIVALSPLVESAAVGGPEQPDYLNAIALISTTLSPLQLLATCQQVESDHRRVRGVHWGPRTLDIDVITYDGVVARAYHLDLPHPLAAQRAFVLAPWLAVDPEAVLPTAQGPRSVAELLAHAPDREAVRPYSAPDLQLPGDLGGRR